MTLFVRRRFAPLLLVAAAMACVGTAHATDRLVRIGVLAHRGKEQALKSWTPTAQYLSHEIPGNNFVIVPLNNDDIGPAVEYRDVEFILTNPGSYAELESSYGVTRIATLKSKTPHGGSSVFGAVIFTRADRKDLQSLADLKGKSFMAVHENAFGGWWMAWREFRRRQIDPYHDFKKLIFAGFPQDKIVYAVRDGKVDAGTVRTDLLEEMAMAGKISLRDFHVLHPRHVENFPYAVSTDLYPDWAFAVLRHTSDTLAQKVAIALLQMQPGDPAAAAGDYEEWTVPLDYHSVQQLMMDLRVGPYRNYGKVGYWDLLRQYGAWLVGAAALLVLLAGAYAYSLRLNRRLIQTKLRLEQEIAQRQKFEDDLCKVRDELELRVAERTAELEKINEELESRVAKRTAQLISAMQKLDAELKHNRNGQ